jgi:tetratricopeptide (TPR) repeat protein
MEEPGTDRKTRRAVEIFEAQIARDPDDAYAYVNMGLWWHWLEHYAKTIDHYDVAIQLDPRFAYARCARASLLATCPDPQFRNGDSAVRDATAALGIASEMNQLTTNWKRRMYLGTLAAALAERGDFDAAVRTQRETLPFCITRTNENAANVRLAQFQGRQALRAATGLIRSGISRERGG